MDTRVIGIKGLAYCGSSIFNLALGAHPDIFGGGELYRAVQRKNEARCAIHGRLCPFWGRRFLSGLDKDTLYEELSRKTGKHVIADSSKIPEWFDGVSAPLTPVLLVKHPLRHVSSYVSNRFPKQAKHEDVGSFIEATLEKMARFYARALDGKNRLVRYEDFISSPEAALTPVLQTVGLSFTPEMLDFAKAVQHPLGGNTGVGVSARFSGLPLLKNLWLNCMAVSPDWRRFYKQSSGLVLDNKYLDILTPTQIDALENNAAYRALCQTLGYDTPLKAVSHG